METLKELLEHGKQFLGSSAIDAALLLAKASGLSREQLYSRPDYQLDQKQCTYYFELLERRHNGECIAYILGKKEFWGLELFIGPAVLVPRQDTETLVEAVIAILRSKPDCNLPILDLCTGSGAVAIALKHEFPNRDVYASDISEKALQYARQNAGNLNCTINLFQSDLFEAFLSNKNSITHSSMRFSLICANAPYVPAKDIAGLPLEVQNEPRIALDGGSDGLEIIRRIINDAPLYLENGGSLVLEADPSQMEAIAELMQKRGFNKAQVFCDLAGKNRIIAASISTIQH